MTTEPVQLPGEARRRHSRRGNPVARRALIAVAWMLSSAFDAAAADLPPRPVPKQAAIDAQVAPAQAAAIKSAVVPGNEPSTPNARTQAKGQGGAVVRPHDGDAEKPRRPPPPPPALDGFVDQPPERATAPTSKHKHKRGPKPEPGEPQRPAATPAK